MIKRIPHLRLNRPAAQFSEMTFNKQCKHEGAVPVRAADPEYPLGPSAGPQHVLSRPELLFSLSL